MISRAFFRQSVSALLEEEQTIVLLVHDHFCGENCKSLFLNTVHLLSTDSILLNADFSPFWLLTNTPVSILSFRALNEVPRPDHLINVSLWVPLACKW